MKFSGTKDLEIELLPDNSVSLTMRYASAYEAAIAYDEISTAAKTGKLRVNFGLGEILEQEGPQTR
jgi:hypothetical protein